MNEQQSQCKINRYMNEYLDWILACVEIMQDQNRHPEILRSLHARPDFHSYRSRAKFMRPSWQPAIFQDILFHAV